MVRRNPPALREATVAASLDYTATLPVWFNAQPLGLLKVFAHRANADISGNVGA
jgi:hypothetical protein